VCISTGTSCSAWRAYAKSLIVNLSGSDGAKTVRVWWKDAAGNVSAKPATASITLDRTAPVTGKLTLRTSGGTANYSWVGFRDYGSGIARYKLVTRSDAPVPEKCTIGTTVFEGGASAKAATQPVEPGKLYYARLCAIDAVGNVTAGIGGQFETLVR
jgi:hypothetical protein